MISSERKRLSIFPVLLTVLSLFAGASGACDLCAIYNAGNTRGETAGGFLISVAEQFIPFRTQQFKSDEVSTPNADYLDSSITHIVPAYNFGKYFGVSLNAPVVYHDFKRKSVVVDNQGLTKIISEQGTESGLGDMSLIGRWTVFRRAKMQSSVLFNLLAGVKFPTGDAEPLRDEATQVRRYNAVVGPGHVHDALGTPVSGVHARDVSVGSGSFDGVFGATLNFRWDRWFFNSQAQYYLRTEGESTYEYGDELMISGGPGAYLWSQREFTLSLQANVAYETEARDELFGQKSNHTGMTAWYAGPQLNLTAGEHFSANIGVDIPWRIANNGFQNVPDYRIHGGVSWRF